MPSKAKSQKGITLAALTVYIFIFTLIIGVITTISNSFYANIGDVVDAPKYISEFNKFTMFFAVDIKNYNTAEVTETTIQFSDTVKYEFKDNSIYRNDVRIAKDILSCNFVLNTERVNTTNKNICTVNMQIGEDAEDSITKNVDFTLKYW